MSERQHEKVLKAFRPLVEATARRYEGKGALYEDLVQEGYLAVLDLYPRCSDKDYLAKYLKDRVPARVRSAARREWRISGRCEELDPEEYRGAFHPEFPWTLWVAEKLLNERDREIARMVYSGHTQKEIAEKLGLTQQAVSSRLSRIREVLKQEQKKERLSKSGNSS